MDKPNEIVDDSGMLKVDRKSLQAYRQAPFFALPTAAGIRSVPFTVQRYTEHWAKLVWWAVVDTNGAQLMIPGNYFLMVTATYGSMKPNNTSRAYGPEGQTDANNIPSDGSYLMEAANRYCLAVMVGNQKLINRAVSPNGASITTDNAKPFAVQNPGLNPVWVGMNDDDQSDNEGGFGGTLVFGPIAALSAACPRLYADIDR